MGVVVDVAIVGGGMAGVALATALRRQGAKVALVERSAPPEAGPLHGDPGRVIALSEGSRRILDQIGLWEALAAEAAPIVIIEVTEAHRLGRVLLSREEAGVAALGYVVANHALQRAGWNAVWANEGVAIRAPAKMAGMELRRDGIAIRVDQEGTDETIRASLVVGADSQHSLVRQASGIGTWGCHHNRYALVATVVAEHDLAGQAFERFLPEGPLAFLPLGGNRASIVWSLTPSVAAETAELSESAFLDRLRSRFGPALGDLRSSGRRALQPIELALARRFSAPRTALVGNAAHLLHPVAGQGFNLALRDVASLAWEVGNARKRGWEAGSPLMLTRYERNRRWDTVRMTAFTEGLVATFANDWPVHAALRQWGLRLVGQSRLLREILMRQAMALGDAALTDLSSSS